MNLFTLSGCEYVESLDPNSAIAHRVLSYGKVAYRNNTFFISSDPNKFSVQMINAPLIRENDQKIYGVYAFLSNINSYHGCSDLIPAEKLQEVKNQILVDWGIAVLRPLVIATSFSTPRGMAQTKKIIEKSAKFQSDSSGNEFQIAKNVLLQTIKTSAFAQLEVNEIDEKVYTCFDYIDQLLVDKEYLLGNRMFLSDIVVYCHLSRILLPGFPHSELVIRKYRRVITWMKNVASATHGEFTVFPNYLA